MSFVGAYRVKLNQHLRDIGAEVCVTRGNMSITSSDIARDMSCAALLRGNLRNAAALSRELECETGTPNEIVLHAYRRWGDDCFSHFEGACSVCILDEEDDRMLVSRDLMGQYSIFYAEKGGVVFAEHPDVLLKCGAADAVLDNEGICELIGLGPARTPGKTPLSSVHALKCGHYLICDAGGAREVPYAALGLQAHTDNVEQTREHVRYLLEQAINDCVDLHPACMLSGGIDSTALTALLCQRIGRVDSYSVDYTGNESEFVADSFRPEADAPYIRIAAQAFGTRHRNVVLDPQRLADTLDDAVNARGFPGMADVDTSLLLFARRIRIDNANVISGECGDEVFGGYPWFRADAPESTGTFPWSGSVALRESILRRDIRQKLNLSAYIRNAYRESIGSYDLTAIEDPHERGLFAKQRLCFDYFMPNLQERAAKMCAASGLNVLTPLCDDRIVRYVYSVPWNLKRMGGADKGLYREAVRDIVPQQLLTRKKSPYPKTCSPEYTRLIRDKINALIADAKAPLWQFADANQIRRIAQSELNVTDTPWYGQLMAGVQMLAYLLQINSWMLNRGIRTELQ